MTLNINLEEVPFAILEVVKARILANRRKLQQGQQQPRPSLRPKPQFIKQGASSKGWRLPKQAVLVLEDNTVLLVNWEGINPIVNDPQAIFTDQNYFGGNSLRTSSINGVNAVGVIPKALGSTIAAGEIWDVSSSVLPSNADDFTIESWGRHGSQRSSGSFQGFRIDWTYPNGETTFFAINCNLFPGNNLKIRLVVGGVGFSRVSYSELIFIDPPDVNVNSPFHIAVQQQSRQLYFYFNGTVLDSSGFSVTINPEVPQVSKNVHFQFNLLSQPGFGGISSLGQLRTTKGRARYPVGGFTPEALPFSG